jgi:hypothetical protein
MIALELPMTKPYTVALQEASALPMRERIEAEVRFAKALERALGGEDAVAEVYKAWVDASESEANHIDTETAVKAVRWPRAFDAARQAGFNKLGDIGEAHFEVRLERGHAAAG